jgi:hypothetical protein
LDFNNTKRSKGNCNDKNESKGACCNKTIIILLKVANFEGRDMGLKERPKIETRAIEHEKNHHSRGN